MCRNFSGRFFPIRNDHIFGLCFYSELSLYVDLSNISELQDTHIGHTREPQHRNEQHLCVDLSFLVAQLYTHIGHIFAL